MMKSSPLLQIDRGGGVEGRIESKEALPARRPFKLNGYMNMRSESLLPFCVWHAWIGAHAAIIEERESASVYLELI